MRGDSHLLLSILMSLPTAMVLFNLNQQTVNVLTYFLGGIMLGSLLPDVDASDAKIMHGRSKPIGFFGKYLFYRPITWVLRTHSNTFNDRHRGYLHSLLGCFLATLYFAIPVAIIFFVLTFYFLVELRFTLLFWYAWIGLPFGFLMHLTEDSFTKSGVRWLFPRGQPMHSTIRTGHRSEYSMTTAFFLTYGILTVFVYLQPPTLLLLLLTLAATTVLVVVLYAVSPLITKFSKD